MMKSSDKGAIAETAITAVAVELGVFVLRPLQEGRRYDLMFDLDGRRLLRVQCKWGRLNGDIVVVPDGMGRVAGFRRGPDGWWYRTAGCDRRTRSEQRCGKEDDWSSRHGRPLVAL